MWNYIIVGSAGFLVGLMVEFGYLRIMGHRIILPFITGSSRNFTIAAVLLAMISLTTIYNVERTATATAECNEQFRAALKYNTDIAAETREISDRVRDLQVQRRRALDEAFAHIGESVRRPDRDRSGTAEAVERYNIAARILSERYDKLVAYQAELNRNRKSYPEPSCGL